MNTAIKDGMKDKADTIKELKKQVAFSSYVSLTIAIILFLISIAFSFYIVSVIRDVGERAEDVIGMYYGMIIVAAISVIASLVVFRAYSKASTHEQMLQKELLNINDALCALEVSQVLSDPAVAQRSRQEVIRTLLNKCA